MKKILIIANYKGTVGGISGQVEELHKNLNSEDSSNWIGDRRLEIGDCPYHADIFSTQGNVMKRLWKFVELIWKAQKYNVLHIHGCSEWGMLPVVYGVIAGKIWKKRIIVTYHGGGAEKYFEKNGDFARRWLKRADKVIVLNGYLEKVFKDYDIPCVVIPNCITLSEAQERSAYQWETPRFISVRHLRELYNIPCILKAFVQVQKEIPAASLMILGDGPLRGELEEWVRLKVESGKLKEGSVQFVGQVVNSEMPKYLAESDILLSAPRIDNMPVSVLEAMNAGVLVISSRVGGVPYMIENKKNGLLFDMKELENERVNELAKTMLWALEHREESMKMIEAAKEDVKRYSWKNVRQQLLPLYE